VQLHRRHFAPGCLLAVSLGATEILGIRLCFVDHDTPLTGPRIPVGYALQDTEVLILDENGESVGPGHVGEMAVCSPYLALGYWGDAERTRAAFRPEPAWPEARRYRLGDLGILRPDGCLEYLGRTDWQVKVHGHRVETAEVEAALLTLDRVKEAVVVGQETATGGQRLVAYVVPADRSAATVSSLRAALHEQLPDYMVPSAFVLLDALPTTPAGKVDRQAVPAPDAARPALHNRFVPPGDSLRILLTEVWQECLNVRPIGIGDDFFELGGDSVSALEMALRVEELCGRAVPQEALLSLRTVDGLAQLLLQPEVSPDCPPVTEVQRGDAGRALFFLHGDVNGGGLYCVPLARHLGNALPFKAVHPHGVSTPLVPATIEEMASDRLRLLRALQPEGPYLLGGHCNGGLIAFEMAQQLIRQGQRVDFLAVIAPPHVVQWGASLPAATSGVFQVGLHRPAETRAQQATTVDLTGIPYPERGLRLFQAYYNVCARYVVRPYPGSVLVVLPHDELACNGSLRRWGHAALQVHLHVVPGGHLTILASRQVRTVAEVMLHYLRKPAER